MVRGILGVVLAAQLVCPNPASAAVYRERSDQPSGQIRHIIESVRMSDTRGDGSRAAKHVRGGRVSRILKIVVGVAAVIAAFVLVTALSIPKS